jgi:hypothetical protein
VAFAVRWAELVPGRWTDLLMYVEDIRDAREVSEQVAEILGVRPATRPGRAERLPHNNPLVEIAAAHPGELLWRRWPTDGAWDSGQSPETEGWHVGLAELRTYWAPRREAAQEQAKARSDRRKSRRRK